MKVAITGGAGFIGAALCVELAQRRPEWQITAFDNLRRRGSELNLTRLRECGVTFVHGDVRDAHDLEQLGETDALVECSAEPSAIAGLESGLDFVVGTNLLGAYNCFELARRRSAAVIFLSSSRIYPVAALAELRLSNRETRFELAEEQRVTGVGAAGISEAFPLDGARTPYGATKLAAEVLLAEYSEFFGIRTIVNRCGVVAGPGQLARVDQGVIGHWLFAHYFGWPLRYFGFDGSGKQVRDVLHVSDLVLLVEEQLAAPERWNGAVVNVGGGIDRSVSLLELTSLCQEVTGRQVEIEGTPDDPRRGDVPVFISDCSRLFGLTDWRPQRDVESALVEMLEWLRGNEAGVRDALEFGAPEVKIARL